MLEEEAASGPAPGRSEKAPTFASGRRIVVATLLTTAVVTALSYRAPAEHAGTLVGLAFLAATGWLVLRHDAATIQAHGLGLGGLLEPTPLEPARMARDAARALAWAGLVALVILPPFAVGYHYYWHAGSPFALRLAAPSLDEVAAHLFVIALPEEAFFRGWLQTALDRRWAPRFRVLGARIGPALLVAAAVFALGHVLTIRHPARLAVFFPALLFGWLRARTGGIGAPFVLHALCNLFAAALARGYGAP